MSRKETWEHVAEEATGRQADWEEAVKEVTTIAMKAWKRTVTSCAKEWTVARTAWQKARDAHVAALRAKANAEESDAERIATTKWIAATVARETMWNVTVATGEVKAGTVLWKAATRMRDVAWDAAAQTRKVGCDKARVACSHDVTWQAAAWIDDWREATAAVWGRDGWSGSGTTGNDGIDWSSGCVTATGDGGDGQ